MPQNKFASAIEFMQHCVEDLGITSLDQVKDKDVYLINPDGDYEPGNIVFLTNEEYMVRADLDMEEA